MHELNAIATIAYRDLLKFLRDRPRIVISFIFPLIFVGILGSSLESNLGDVAGYSFLVFTFTGVLGQTLFQSTSSGVISLIEDRENDFSQEVFVSPISRYSIVIGKIIGESFVSLFQVAVIIAFGFLIGIPLTLSFLLAFIPLSIIICLLGGAFGILVLSNLNSQRAANQIFPFIILPQFFLAGVFSPIKDLPVYLWILSRIAPMTYAVDFVRGIFYWGRPEYDLIVIFHPLINLLVITVMTLLFIAIGTYLFIKKEGNK